MHTRSKTSVNNYSNSSFGSGSSSAGVSVAAQIAAIGHSPYQNKLRSQLYAGAKRQDANIELCGQSANGNRIFYVENDLVERLTSDYPDEPLVQDALLRFANIETLMHEYADRSVVEFDFTKNETTYTARLGYDAESGKIIGLSILHGPDTCVSSSVTEPISASNTSEGQRVRSESIAYRLRNMQLNDDTAPESVRLERIGYSSRIRFVSDATMALREQAQQLIWDAMDIFPWGCGNQIIDIISSNGEAAVRHQLLYADADAMAQLEKIKPDASESYKLITLNDFQERSKELTKKSKLNAVLKYAQYVAQYAGPNCDDMAAYTTALAVCNGLGKDRAIYLVEDACHCFTVIGEPNDPDSIVMCLWSGVPLVCTLEEFEFMPEEIIAKFPPESEKAFALPKNFDLHQRLKDRPDSDALPALKIEGRKPKQGDKYVAAQLLLEREADRLARKERDEASADDDGSQLFTHIWSTATPDTLYVSAEHPHGKPINRIPKTVADKLAQKMARVLKEFEKRLSPLAALKLRPMEFQELSVASTTVRVHDLRSRKCLTTWHRDEFKHVAVEETSGHTPLPIDSGSGARFYQEVYHATLLENAPESRDWQYAKEAVALNTLMGGRVVEADVYEERLEEDCAGSEEERDGLSGMRLYLKMHLDYGDDDVKLVTLRGKKNTTAIAGIERDIGHQLVLKMEGQNGYIVLRKDVQGDWHSIGIDAGSDHIDKRFDRLASAFASFSSEHPGKKIQCLYLTKDAQPLELHERPLKRSDRNSEKAMADKRLASHRASDGGFKRQIEEEQRQAREDNLSSKRISTGTGSMNSTDVAPMDIDDDGAELFVSTSQSTNRSSALRTQNMVAVQKRVNTTVSPSPANTTGGGNPWQAVSQTTEQMTEQMTAATFNSVTRIVDPNTGAIVYAPPVLLPGLLTAIQQVTAVKAVTRQFFDWLIPPHHLTQERRADSKTVLFNFVKFLNDKGMTFAQGMADFTVFTRERDAFSESRNHANVRSTMNDLRAYCFYLPSVDLTQIINARKVVPYSGIGLENRLIAAGDLDAHLARQGTSISQLILDQDLRKFNAATSAIAEKANARGMVADIRDRYILNEAPIGTHGW